MYFYGQIYFTRFTNSGFDDLPTLKQNTEAKFETGTKFKLLFFTRYPTDGFNQHKLFQI